MSGLSKPKELTSQFSTLENDIDILNTKIESINENSLEMSSVCPKHGLYKTKIENL